MHSDEQPSTTRRDFLHQATGLAACLSAAGVEAAEPPAKADPPKAEPRLPTIKLGPHQVTRLIIGGNPIYGHSHFNKLFSAHMIDWHTPDRVQALDEEDVLRVHGADRARGAPRQVDPLVLRPRHDRLVQ